MAKPLRERLLSQSLIEKVQGGYVCNASIVEILARQAQSHGEYSAIVEAAKIEVPYKEGRYYYYSSQAQRDVLRKIRDALYLAKDDVLRQELIPKQHLPGGNHDYLKDLFNLCTRPFDPQWFASILPSTQALILEYRIKANIFPAEAPDYDYLMQLWQDNLLNDPGLRGILMEWRLENLQFDNTDSLLSTSDDWHNQLMQARLLALKGEYTEAIPGFLLAQKKLRKEMSNTRLSFTGEAGLYYCLCLLQSSEPKHKIELSKQFRAIARRSGYDGLDQCFVILDAVQQVLTGAVTKGQCPILSEKQFHPNYQATLFRLLAWHWLGEKPTAGMLASLAKCAVLARENDQAWYVQQSLALLQHYKYVGTKASGFLALKKSTPGLAGLSPLLSLIQPQAPWERALQALQGMDPDKVSAAKGNASQQTRIVWIISDSLDDMHFQPKEQKLSAKGLWSKGRNISLKRLMQSLEEADTLSAEDLKICACIEKEYEYYGPEYCLDIERALLAAVGHPLLFLKNKPDKSVELLRGEIELIVQEKQKTLTIQLHPLLPSSFDEDDGEYDDNAYDEYEDDGGYYGNSVLQKEGTQRLRIFKFSAQHLQIARILGQNGLTVPLSAKDQVLESINAIAPLLPIQSDIGGGNLDAREVPADSKLYMQVQAQKDSFNFRLCVQPLGNNGPQFRPGDGRVTVLAEVEGERLHTSRNLALEEEQYQTLLKQTPVLEHIGWDEHEYEWELEGEDALEALYQLQTYGEPLVLLWPKGGTLSFNRESTLGDMHASVRKTEDWFSLEGKLQLDDGQVMSMAKLMTLMDQSPGRFIRLDDGTFLTLTRQLSQRLEALKRHGGEQFHPLAATALEELTEGMQLDSDKQWQQQKEVITEAYSLNPEIPATMQAELRDYQQEGFAWLVRLAHWGAGACLADDMGLGKTIQALALILNRAADGPCLVLAPTSVCMNWLNETLRFTPTLKAQRFGEGDRQKTLAQAGPFDVIICSYGLLKTEAESLQQIQWHTIVADEAQALKNSRTKRAQAAMGLKGDFKIITTGTPIENHLGELWSLFRFINPGLLGSLESFNQRFAGPIENNQDKPARLDLKRLVQPFILRRLKRDVLTELPSRTEITVSVPQSEEEKIFYEALRRKAVENLANNSDKPGQKQLKILAEIMKLRRACCNPRLVMPNSTIPSSKLAAFGEIVEELRDNNHRALVFSQFVGHLQLIREYLDERNIHYQYLDGSTPVKKREAAVNAFQGGAGELFLISLKAGGSGLNLTAADYVVHMDPWWNPAVEDQASDRAHRIGQKRPVTIYRLVSENTIEQKIIALHSQKRDLADSLLEGSDMSGKLSADDIMRLIEDVS